MCVCVCVCGLNTRYEVNRYIDNIGARRLHTVLERVLDEASFDASEEGRKAKEEGRECVVTIDEQYVCISHSLPLHSCPTRKRGVLSVKLQTR